MTALVTNINSHGLTMSSREIADLTGKQHHHVKRDVQVMLTDLGIDVSKFGCTYHDSLGRTQTEYQLPKDETLCLMTGYDVKARMTIIKRWQQLEGEGNPEIPQTYAESLRLAADLADRNQALEHQVQQQAEQISSMEALFREGMTPTQFCKGLNGVNVMAINQLLAERKWLFREGGHWRVASYARDQYLTEQQSQIRPRDAEPFVQYKPVLLRKGAVRLYQLYLGRQLVMKANWNGEFTHDKTFGQVA